MVALYLLITKRYLWALLSTVFFVVFLKRVAMLAFVIALLVWLSPKRIRSLILHPVTLTAGGVAVMVASIAFAQGWFDNYVFDYLGRSPNDFSKGARSCGCQR